jgi:uncharacterized membrane protein HdeD (DUF308 family)
MITFGYRSKLGGIARAVIALILGAVMFFTGNSVTIIVQIMAAFILASGLASLIIGLKKEDQRQRPLVLTNSGLNIVIAVLMFVFAENLGGLFVAIIGIILVLFSVFQLIVLVSANRVTPVGATSFIMPAVVLACGALLLFKPKFVEDMLGYIVGASLIIYGVSEIISSRKVARTMADLDQVQDVDFEKVDEQ